MTLSPHVILIGCSAAKLKKPAPARELYTGDLFKLSLQYVARANAQAYVVSALHGLVELDKVIEPYDFAFGKLEGERARDHWGGLVVEQLHRRYPSPPRRLELLLGDTYVRHLFGPLRYLASSLHAVEVRWPAAERPLKGLGIGFRKRALLEGGVGG